MGTHMQLLCLSLAAYLVSTLISMAIMNIGAAVYCAVFLGVVIWEKKRSFKTGDFLSKNLWFHRYFWISVFLVLACSLSSVVAHFNPLVILSKAVPVEFPRDFIKTWYFALPIVHVLTLRRLNTSQIRFVLWVWVGAFGLLSVLGITQYYFGWDWMRSRVIPIPSAERRYHVDLWLGHHLSAANILIFPFFAALDWLRKSFALKKNFQQRCVLFGILAVGGVALLFTYSRMLWLSMGVGLVIYLVIVLPRRVLAPAIIIIALLTVAVSQIPHIQTRIQDLSGHMDREVLWKANRYYFSQRPWTGIGFRKNQEMSESFIRWDNPKVERIFSGHAHNNVLEMLGGTGLVGTLAWFIWNIFIFMLLWKNFSEGALFGAGFLIVWAIFHINGITQVNFWEGKVLHQVMWMVGLSLYFQQKPKKSLLF